MRTIPIPPLTKRLNHAISFWRWRCVWWADGAAAQRACGTDCAHIASLNVQHQMLSKILYTQASIPVRLLVCGIFHVAGVAFKIGINLAL